MAIYGVDVSAYQPGFDFQAAARDGMAFAIVKATEGTGWKSPNYRDQIAKARAAGMLVAAYHYVRGSDVQGQFNNIVSLVSRDTPVILDVEDGAGSIQSIRDLNSRLNQAGYRTPFIYIPKWYWSGHMGSPNLAGLPPNWLSWYPDYTVRRAKDAANKLPAAVWQAFGGLPIGMVQMTSSMAVANYPNGSIDGNVFPGTRAQLAAILNGDEDDMFTDADRAKLDTLFAFHAESANAPGGQTVHDAIWDLTNRLGSVVAAIENLPDEMLDREIEHPTDTETIGSHVVPKKYTLRDFVRFGNLFAREAAENTRPAVQDEGSA